MPFLRKSFGDLLSTVSIAVEIRDEKIQHISLARGRGLVWKGKVSSELKNQIEYFFRCFDLAPPLPPYAIETIVSSFAKDVSTALIDIPYGETRTYGEIASAVGNAHAARAVGMVCKFNPFPLLIPCHRVVAQHGIGGFGPGVEVKKKLLDLEWHENCVISPSTGGNHAIKRITRKKASPIRIHK